MTAMLIYLNQGVGLTQDWMPLMRGLLVTWMGLGLIGLCFWLCLVSVQMQHLLQQKLIAKDFGVSGIWTS